MTRDVLARPVAFARWRSGVASGGNRYDDTITAAFGALGIDVREYFLEGPWPTPGEQDREALTELLRSEPVWLVDNILASAAPDPVTSAVAAGHRVAVLVHYFPADDPAHSAVERSRLAETEAAAIRAATTVVATSAWTAEQVRRRYGREDVAVAVPGVESAPLAPGTPGRPHLLWLARVTETKDPLTCVDALLRVRDRDWTAQLVGPDDLDADLSAEVRGRIAAAGLTDRIELTGARHGTELESIWNRTDLLVHTARTEPYGMVVTEALARGIPSIVPDGTGAAEAQQGAGARFPAGDVEALAATVEQWLTAVDVRRAWSDAARYRRDHLPTWHDAAEVVARACLGDLVQHER